MKKIDFLVIKSFIGPFILTTCVVVFIFLMRFLMLYFNDFVGKDLGYDVFAKLFVYFSLITVPISLPLATLLASLMCFGNLGEHSELTAIKASGIPISRVLVPTLVFAFGVSIFSFWFNNKVSPWANLKGYSLLYDVKTTKVTLNIKEGIFYGELPGYKIKVLKKYPDGKTLKGVTIYNHTTNEGNVNVTLADSGKMYTMLDNNYLVFELYNGINYMDYKNTNGGTYNETQYVKNSFKKNRLVFALESFGMKRTDESQFKYHEYMKDVSALNRQVDSIHREIALSKKVELGSMDQFYNHHLKKIIKDTLSKRVILPGKWVDQRMKPLHEESKIMESFETAFTQAKSVQDHYKTALELQKSKLKDANRSDVERWHKFTMAFACFVMFLIGSSLGSIIKKGGFGMPVLIAITFFILMYVLMQLGDKYAKESVWYVIPGVWMPDAVLLCFGLYFLYKATNDARLFDSDIYDIYFDKIKTYFKTKFRKKNSLESASNT